MLMIVTLMELLVTMKLASEHQNVAEGDKQSIALLKVKRHDHRTGRFLYAAHSQCSLAMRVPRFVPVFSHNLTGYDGHLLHNGVASVCRA